jgi:hypothetical protein
MSARRIYGCVTLAVSILLNNSIRLHAQAVVYFNNSVLFDLGCGDTLVRGPDDSPLTSTNYVAQLYYGPSANALVAHTSAPAPFRPGTSGPGIWLGGNRTLTGLSPGQLAVLSVRAWDVRSGATYEQAFLRKDNGPFYYQVPTGSNLSPTNFFMYNFRANNALTPIPTNPPPPFFDVQPQSQTVRRSENVMLTVAVSNGWLGHWRFNGNVIDLSSPCRDARTLLLTNVQPSHAGAYQFIAENYSACVTSQVAVLTVVTPPQLTAARYDQGAFAFQVLEDTSRQVVIETAPDLNPSTTWNPVFTNTAPFWFTNSTATDRQRFYRTVFR